MSIVDELLGATNELVVATGIVNIWQSDAHEVAASYARIEARHPGRFLLGVGAGHREAIRQYAKPCETLAAYVDVLVADGVPADDLVSSYRVVAQLDTQSRAVAGLDGITSRSRSFAPSPQNTR